MSALDFQHVDARYRPWLALFEAGWSFEKIADAWTTKAQPQTAAVVERILDKLPLEPIAALPTALPVVEKLDEAKAQSDRQRSHIRYLAQVKGWTLEQLQQVYPLYAPSMLEHIIGKASGPRKSRSKLDPKRVCPCGCKKRSTGRRGYFSDACRKKVARKNARSVV
jgi:hypothetical protein